MPQRRVKSIETESRRQVTRSWQDREMEMCCFLGTVSVLQNQKVLEVKGGDGCARTGTYLMPLNCALKMVKVGTLTPNISHHHKNATKKATWEPPGHNEIFRLTLPGGVNSSVPDLSIASRHSQPSGSGDSDTAQSLERSSGGGNQMTHFPQAALTQCVSEAGSHQDACPLTPSPRTGHM